MQCDESLSEEAFFIPTWVFTSFLWSIHISKVEKIWEDSLDLIPLPSPSVKILIIGRGNKAKHWWVMSASFLFSRVCWQGLAMFCLYTTSKQNLNFLFLFFQQNINVCCHQTFFPTSLFTAPSNVLPLHHKPTFLPIIQNFTEGEIFFYFTKL